MEPSTRTGQGTMELDDPLKTSHIALTESCVILNRGASRHGDATAGRAMLLTGNPRGGTTFIASAAHHLGIPLGRNRPRYEDRELRELLLGEVPDADHRQLTEAIRRREAAHGLWGWKLPGIARHLELVDGLIQRPIYVMVFKDPLSMAMRKARQGKPNVAASLHNDLAFTQRMVHFLGTTRRECLLVSFDKAIRRQSDLIRALAEVAGIPVTEERVAEIEAAMRADSLRYDRQAPREEAERATIKAERKRQRRQAA